MISSLCWIPKGVAKEEPVQAELEEEDLAELKAAAGDTVNEDADDMSDSESSDGEEGGSDSSDGDMDEEQQIAKAKAMATALKSTSGGAGASASRAPVSETLAEAMAELDMEHYDDSDEESGAVDLILGAGNPGMAYHKNPDDDPYLKQGAARAKEDSDDESSSSEAEDLRLRENDLLILAARNEDDVSYLEVWVYEEPDERGEGNLYVHHSVMLPAFPLSVTWLDCDPGGKTERGNFAAVGSFEPGIEVWDLDVLDAVEPACTLGGFDLEAARAAEVEEGGSGGSDKKKKKKKKKAKLPPMRPDSHEDAVLGLSWNQEFRNVLASASADKTVKVWDVATQQCRHTLRHHSGKVQAVSWNPAEASVLLTGAFDKQACLVDMRAPEGDVLRWQTTADVEALAWVLHAPTNFLVASEDGIVACFDARQGAGSAPLYQLAAHDKATCALSFCPAVPGLLMTASTDKKVKLWDVSGSAPVQLAVEDLKVGAVFSAGFCRDSPMLLAAGGSKGTVSVWDTTTNSAVAAFAQQRQQEVAAT